MQYFHIVQIAVYKQGQAIVSFLQVRNQFHVVLFCKGCKIYKSLRFSAGEKLLTRSYLLPMKKYALLLLLCNLMVTAYTQERTDPWLEDLIRKQASPFL